MSCVTTAGYGRFQVSRYSAYARFRSSCMSFTAESKDAARVLAREVVSSQSLSRNQAGIVMVQGKGCYHLSAIAGLLLHIIIWRGRSRLASTTTTMRRPQNKRAHDQSWLEDFQGPDPRHFLPILASVPAKDLHSDNPAKGHPS